MLLTTDRLRALHNINRWGGWLKRPYSVLEHTLIGAELMIHLGQNPVPFLLHDLEETEFGDLTTPNKNRYTNGRYRSDVDRWVGQLCSEVGIHTSDLHNTDVKIADHVIAHAEHLTVATRGDPSVFGLLPVLDDVRFAMGQIENGKYQDRDLAIVSFWGMYNEHKG